MEEKAHALNDQSSVAMGNLFAEGGGSNASRAQMNGIKDKDGNNDAYFIIPPTLLTYSRVPEMQVV